MTEGEPARPATRTTRWMTAQARAFCCADGCEWYYHGRTSNADRGQSQTVLHARRHCEQTGHDVRVERGQIRYTVAGGS